jgi:hypothetical protein
MRSSIARDRSACLGSYTSNSTRFRPTPSSGTRSGISASDCTFTGVLAVVPGGEQRFRLKMGR